MVTLGDRVVITSNSSSFYLKAGEVVEKCGPGETFDCRVKFPEFGKSVGFWSREVKTLPDTNRESYA